MARTFGWKIMRQAGGLFYILGPDKRTIENPYVGEDAIKTDFTRRDRVPWRGVAGGGSPRSPARAGLVSWR